MKQIDTFFPEEFSRVSLNNNYITPTNPQNYIYHYTNISCILSILRNREIWLMDQSTLNDSAEGTLLSNKVIEMFATKKDKNILSQMFDIIKTNTFVSSFSTFGNLLSQWRCYGDISIGFQFHEMKYNSHMIEDSKQTNHLTSGFQFSPCQYATTRIIEEEAIALKKYFKQYLRTFKNEDNRGQQHALLTIGQWLFTTKHAGFFEESEIRGLYYLYQCSPFTSPTGKNYLKYKIAPEMVKRITVGPSTNHSDNAQQITDYISDNPEYNHLEIYESTIPYIDKV